MKLRNLVFLTLIATSAAFTGCSSCNKTAHNETTVLGLYTYEPACFTPSDPAAMKVRTKDLFGMDLPSGDRTQFLWGLISIEDY